MDKKLSFLVLVFFLVLGTFASFVLQRETRLTRAASQVPEALQSFMIVSAKGLECTINVIVRDSAQKGVPSKEVCVTSTFGSVSPSCTTTNESGIAEVTITAPSAGTGNISANVTGLFDIPTQVSCLFTQ
ncbi:MAG: Bacterial Ig-like domain (group 1) [Microgenomates bacterium OLB23]|nr:MAG: Bacterial Ig-like domain (group 1) [Microgenomates bacterium OLB23]